VNEGMEGWMQKELTGSSAEITDNDTEHRIKRKGKINRR